MAARAGAEGTEGILSKSTACRQVDSNYLNSGFSPSEPHLGVAKPSLSYSMLHICASLCGVSDVGPIKTALPQHGKGSLGHQGHGGCCEK